MGLNFNGVTPDSVKYNNNSVDVVNYNGNEIWTSSPYKVFFKLNTTGLSSFYTNAMFINNIANPSKVYVLAEANGTQDFKQFTPGEHDWNDGISITPGHITNVQYLDNKSFIGVLGGTRKFFEIKNDDSGLKYDYTNTINFGELNAIVKGSGYNKTIGGMRRATLSAPYKLYSFSANVANDNIGDASNYTLNGDNTLSIIGYNPIVIDTAIILNDLYYLSPAGVTNSSVSPITQTTFDNIPFNDHNIAIPIYKESSNLQLIHSVEQNGNDTYINEYNWNVSSCTLKDRYKIPFNLRYNQPSGQQIAPTKEYITNDGVSFIMLNSVPNKTAVILTRNHT